MFRPGQKVFGKVRGYPPWPAKVLDVIDEAAANKQQKFRVYFYGTKETGICKVDELYDYIEHREKYGKPLKRKCFSEAIEEIEQELDPSFRKENPISLLAPAAVTETSVSSNANPSASAIKDSDDEGNLVIDESPLQQQHNKLKTNSKTTSGGDFNNKLLKRKLSCISAPADKSSSDTLSTTSMTEVTSRSGRKIKPKKFLDEPTDNNVNVAPLSIKVNSSMAAASLPSQAPPTLLSSSAAATTAAQQKTRNFAASKETSSSCDEERKVVNKKYSASQIHAVTDSSSGSSNDKDRVELHWNGSQNIKNLIHASEHSYLPKVLKKDFKKSLQKKLNDVKIQQQQQQNVKHYQHQHQSSLDNENLEFLKVEVQLLDADCRIKSSLNLLRANCQDCLSAMDEILELKLNALMLKKHPEVVDTVKKLRKYVGNLSAWNLSREEERTFNEGASKIRVKADHMYNKFQSLFTIPSGKSFFEVYAAEVSRFQEKTVNLPVNEIYGLVEEPSE